MQCKFGAIIAQDANYQHNHAPRSTNDVIGKEKFYFFFFAIVPNKIHTYPRMTLAISKAVLGKVWFSLLDLTKSIPILG